MFSSFSGFEGKVRPPPRGGIPPRYELETKWCSPWRRRRASHLVPARYVDPRRLDRTELSSRRRANGPRRHPRRNPGPRGARRELADEVIAFDDEVDRHFLGIERSIQALLALQTPVARDLRLLLAMIHINLLLERSADGCVTIAKLSKLVSDVEPDPALVEGCVRWASGPRRCARLAGLLRRRDLAGAESLVELDELIDRANRRFVERLVDVMAEGCCVSGASGWSSSPGRSSGSATARSTSASRPPTC